ncbi:hypothetical protein [Winogradskyella flava]|uniref:DUF3558 domain-containing protein n=1 Tax=Winogradskyella flava TaxID=1884876 RepID=A0A842IPM0_9FLAO|nr:hypothetical protein [Winogradskyella flava]MBC2843644.1 hypothetical protein [Winogradskyella flava]
MKFLKHTIYVLAFSTCLTSCFGDQKTIIGEDFGDTSFVNENYKGNKKDFSELPKDLCQFLDEASILKGYDNATSVSFNGKNSFGNKNCQFNVVFFNDQSQYIMGSIFINENTNSANWEESWEMKKKRFKSVQYVKNLGMAAIWNGKQRKLEIKMKGYDAMITVPPKMSGKNQIDNNTDVKDIAIAIAKSTNLF